MKSSSNSLSKMKKSGGTVAVSPDFPVTVAKAILPLNWLFQVLC